MKRVRILLAAALALSAMGVTGAGGVAWATDVNILLVLPDRLGANYNFNRSNFEQYGWNITTTGTTSTVNPCTWYNSQMNPPTYTVDLLVSEIDDITQWDAIALMNASWRTGVPYGDLRGSQIFLDLVVDAVDAGLVVYAPCAGVMVLADAGVLDGVNVTGQENFISYYTDAGAIWAGTQVLPVIDGNIVTCSRGMYYNHENNEAIARALDQTRHLRTESEVSR